MTPRSVSVCRTRRSKRAKLRFDISDYDRIYQKLTRVSNLFDVSSSFAMEQIKYTTAVAVCS